MAIIVNDRDVLLQSTTPRVQQVGLPPNVAIDPNNVPGLAAAFDALKEVSLSATSQVFVVPKIGAIQPAAIEISALLRSITGTPTFTLVDGTVSFTNNGSKITIAATDMASPTATIEVSVLFNSVVYKDRITIGKIAEGSDAVVGLLSNESVTVAATDLGVVSQAVLATAGGTFSIFDGVINKSMSGNVAYSVLSETGCDLSIDASGVYTVNSISSNTANAVLRAVYSRGTTQVVIDKVYSIAKAVAGIVGSNAKLLYLAATSQIFQIPKSGNVTPAAITLTATGQNLDSTAAYTWTTTPNMALTSGATSNIKTLSFANMTADMVKIDVSRDGLTDTITLVKVREGNDSIVGYLTNESVVVPADSGGVVPSSAFTTSGGTFEVYQGLTRLTGTGVTYSVISESGVDVSINTSTGVYSIVSMSSDSGVATFRASLTVAGTTVNIDKVYTIAKSRAGKTGDSASGTRGTVNISSAISGNTWTDAAANSALASAGYGVPQSRDIVTLFNGATSFSESRFWSGSAWITLDAYINGNLLVNRTVASAAIATGAIQAEHINVANGSNMLQNSSPSWKTAYSWNQGWNNNPGSTMAGPGIDRGWCPAGGSAAYVLLNGPITAGREFEIVNSGPNAVRYQCLGGQRYEFSACISAHRCTAKAFIYFFDAAGVGISLGTGAGNVVATSQNSATTMGNFSKSRGFTTAPPNAATCIFVVQGITDGQANPYIFASYAFMAAATVNQNVFTPWTEGGMTTIDAAGITTPNLSSISADIGKVTSGHVYSVAVTGGPGYPTPGYNWPESQGGALGGGFCLNSGGLLLGDPRQGAYFQVTSAGNVYAPNFSLEQGNLVMRGSVSTGGMTGFGWPGDGSNGAHIGPYGLLVGNAAVPGRPYLHFNISTSDFSVWTPYMSFSGGGAYFAGTLRASIVDTDQLVERSVTSPVYSAFLGPGADFWFNVPKYSVILLMYMQYPGTDCYFDGGLLESSVWYSREDVGGEGGGQYQLGHPGRYSRAIEVGGGDHVLQVRGGTGINNVAIIPIKK